MTLTRFQPILSLRAARILSLVAPAGLLLSALGGAIFPGPDGKVLLAFTVLRIIFVLLSLGLFIDARGQPTNAYERFDHLFDERESKERDQAFRKSHNIVIRSLFVLAVYAALALKLGLWLPDTRGAIDIALGLIFVAAGLPGMIMVWREREEAE
jgi:hypothetical protein